MGQLTQEGVTTKIKTLGLEYEQKILVGTTTQNWLKTLDLLKELKEGGMLLAVFVHFTEHLIFQCTSPGYSDIWARIVAELVETNCLFFIYEDNLLGKYREWAWTNDGKLLCGKDQWQRYYERQKMGSETNFPAFMSRHAEDIQSTWVQGHNEALTKAAKVIDHIRVSKLDIAPYQKRIQLTVRIQEFLEAIENGVLLRLYVPNGQYQADQLASFLRLLENYLRNVEQRSFSVDVRNAAHGNVYIFKSQDDLGQTGLDQAVRRFESFMELCQNDITQARAILEKQQLNTPQTESLLTRYVRDYQRLNLDVRQEYEQKTLALKHRLEGSLLETSIETETIIARPFAHASLLTMPYNFGTVQVHLSDSSNHENQIIQTAIEQTFSGDIQYGIEDRELLKLFEKHAEYLEAAQLKSILDEIKDESSAPEQRQTGRQKIVAFLAKIAPLIGHGVVAGLADYLQKKIGGLP